MIAWITNLESKTLGEMVEYNMANQKFLKKNLNTLEKLKLVGVLLLEKNSVTQKK